MPRGHPRWIFFDFPAQTGQALSPIGNAKAPLAKIAHSMHKIAHPQLPFARLSLTDKDNAPLRQDPAMSSLAPPPDPPRVAATDPDGLGKLRRRLFQIAATVLTVVITAWFCTLGPFLAIVALTFAKHILVAILMMSVGVDSREPIAHEPCPHEPTP
jgi:hypothetical protein